MEKICGRTFQRRQAELTTTNESTVNESINEIGSDIITLVIHAIKVQKNETATGPDNIYAEAIKLIDKQESKRLELLIALFNAVHKSKEVSYD